MDEFEGRVALITGAAGGIGRALARRWAREGMRLVLTDRDGEGLEAAAQELNRDVETLAVTADVSRAADVEELGAAARRRFGVVHVICNNAGLAAFGRTWEFTEDDWRELLGANLWGVVHGLRVFVPPLLASGEPGHVVNTASLAGLIHDAGMAPYRATKHAVVALSETLRRDLEQTGNGQIGVSVLCPGFVRTEILSRIRFAGGSSASEAERKGQLERARLALDAGEDPEDLAAAVVEAVRSGRFLVPSDPSTREAAERGPRAGEVVS